MDKVTIVGGGFSSFLAKIMLGDKASVITLSNPNILLRNGLDIDNAFVANKIFGKKSFSYTELKSNLDKFKLHDRLTIGGNSNIWGGVIDVEHTPKNIIKMLKENEVIIKPLSFINTGSISNNHKLAQMQNKDGSILDVSDFFKLEENRFLHSFFFQDQKIGLNIISENNNEIMFTNNLILCTGVVQIIDLLYRSGFLKNNDILKLSEFAYRRSFTATYKPYNFNNQEDEVTVRFDFFRALCHFLGIQKRLWISNLSKFIPLYVDQKFTNKKSDYSFRIKNGSLYDINDNSKKSLSSASYGDSIHYNNLEINNVNINTFLESLCPRIHGLGMAFVNQLNAGPISNDISKDANIKIMNLIKNL